MEELYNYKNRLVGIGYTEEDAKNLVAFYFRQGDLDGLESYIICKESLEVID